MTTNNLPQAQKLKVRFELVGVAGAANHCASES
jgi:hypothetical protein